MILMGPPITKGPEAHSVRAGQLHPVQRTMEEMRLFGDFSSPLGRGPLEKSGCEIRGGTGRKELGIA